jgi:hypothetical protein
MTPVGHVQAAADTSSTRDGLSTLAGTAVDISRRVDAGPCHVLASRAHMGDISGLHRGGSRSR